LKKRLTGTQEGELENFKKTFPKYKLTNYETLARLRRDDIFDYKHKPRLYKETSETILQMFYDLGLIFHRLPMSYRIKILSNSTVYRFFTDYVFNVLANDVKKKTKKRKDEQETFDLYSLYQTFFSIGLEGYVNMMPNEFRHYLLKELKPIVNLMYSIAMYHNKVNPRKPITVPYIPSSLAEVRGT